MRRFLRFWLRVLAIWLMAASTCAVYLLFNIANDVRKATTWRERQMYETSQTAENRHPQPSISVKRLEPQSGEPPRNPFLKYSATGRVSQACERAARNLLLTPQGRRDLEQSIDQFGLGISFAIIKSFKPGEDPTNVCIDAVRGNRVRLGAEISDADFESLVDSIKLSFEQILSRAD
jgi:hypothetical protein